MEWLLPILSLLLALLGAVIGGTWKLSRMLARLELHMESVPSRLQHVESGLMMLEDDVNNLWAAARSPELGPALLDATRHPRFKPYEPKKDR